MMFFFFLYQMDALEAMVCQMKQLNSDCLGQRGWDGKTRGKKVTPLQHLGHLQSELCRGRGAGCPAHRQQRWGIGAAPAPCSG